MTSLTTNQIKCTAQCFLQWLLRDNFKSSDLLKAEQVPAIHRELYIYTGYRPIYKPWKYYIHSMFHLHNETINIWTHLIGFFIILFRLIHLLKDYDVINDHVTWPIMVFGLCSLLSMVLSALAHLLHSKSPWHHYVLFMLDYAAIAVYGFGVGVGSMYISSHHWFRNTFYGYYLPANILVSVFVFYAFCKARINNFSDDSQRKRLMIVSTVGQGLFLFAPVAPRYTECFNNPDCSLDSMNHVTTVLVLDVICAATFVALLPERLIPGRCDIFGHSHQIFHTIAVVTIMAKISAMNIDLSEANDIISKIGQPSEQLIYPSFLWLLLSFSVLMVFHSLTYFYFLNIVKTSIKSKKSLKNKSL